MAPNNGVHVDTAAGQSSAKNVDGLVAEMKGIISQIQGSADQGRAGWGGSAAGAFTNVHGEWQDIAHRLNSSLDEIASALNVSMKSYDGHDSENASLLNGAMGGGTGLLNL